MYVCLSVRGQCPAFARPRPCDERGARDECGVSDASVSASSVVPVNCANLHKS